MTKWTNEQIVIIALLRRLGGRATIKAHELLDPDVTLWITENLDYSITLNLFGEITVPPEPQPARPIKQGTARRLGLRHPDPLVSAEPVFALFDLNEPLALRPLFTIPPWTPTSPHPWKL